MKGGALPSIQDGAVGATEIPERGRAGGKKSIGPGGVDSLAIF